MKRVLLLLIPALAFAFSDRVSALTTNAQGLVTYTAFNGTLYNLKPWLGRNIVVLTPNSAAYQTNIMLRIIPALDRAYDFYELATARRPPLSSATSFEDRDTVAVVNSTCGAGCSQVGTTGTEILNQYFQILYNAVASANQYDQVLFYEFGRSYWFYTSQLAYFAPDVDPVVTGYAVYMRFLSMQAAGVAGAPFNGSPFTSFATAVTNLIDTYVRTPGLNWSNTFRINVAPSNTFGLGGTDLIASLLMHIGRDFGGPRFGLAFWKQAEFRPAARTTLDAANNFVLTACAATGLNLTHVFATTWKWPVSPAAFQEAQLHWGAPVTFRPFLLSSNTTSDTLKVSWQSQVNFLYQPQQSSDFLSWFNIGDPIPGDGSVLSLFNSNAVDPQRFFRLEIQ